MKKRVLSLVLTLMMVLAVLPAMAFAENEQALTGNLLKVTTTADFQAGECTGLVIETDVGNGAIALEDGVTVGTYISPVFSTDTWRYAVASWSASIYDGGQVEIWARARIDGEWSGWMSWGPYSPFISRGSSENKTDTIAYVDDDQFSVRNSKVADAVQVKAVVSRDTANVESPVLRQVALTFKGGAMEPTYAEETVDLPDFKLNPAPAYSQGIRHPSIGGSICSPTTVSVMLNSRNPELNILPEELAINIQDNGAGIFGNWAFSASGAGLYGYESYVQYASKDILLQELAQGRTVGLSVKYSSSENGSYPYLENAYSNTGGHLITIIGYEYKDGIRDDEHLYFFSSDSYAKDDTDAYRSYKWTQLDKCWSNRVAYIVPSLEPETNADITGVTRVIGTLKQDAHDNTLYTMVDRSGNAMDMERILDAGTVILAYTVEGFDASDPAVTDHSIAYEEAIRVEANRTFFYSDISVTSNGQIRFNAEKVLRGLGIGRDDPRTVTVYVMGSTGYLYKAEMEVTISPERVIVTTPGDAVTTTTVRSDAVYVSLSIDNLEGGISVGLLVPEDADISAASVTVNGASAAVESVHTDDENGASYAVVTVDASQLEYRIVIDWGSETSACVLDLKDVVLPENTVIVESGNVVEADLTAGTITDALIRRQDGSIALKKGETQGIYTSPFYDTWDWEYAMGFLGAYTPSGTSADLQIRAFTQNGQEWSKWLSMGSAGAGSTSVSDKDDYVNMDTDVYMIRGSSSVANAQRFQLRVVLTSDGGAVQPAVYHAGLTYKKAAYNPDEAEPLGETPAEEMPAAAGIDAQAFSAYSYRSGMRDWRFENMELIMLDAQGADLLYEEVALANYDHSAGWGNWAMTNYKPGAHGYYGYSQYGANSTLIQKALADGNIVGVYVNGAKVPSTNSSASSQTIVASYYTAEDGTVMFNLICPRGDTSELRAGDVYGTASAAELDEAIQKFSSSSARGLMYVVGAKEYASSWERVKAEAVMTDRFNETFTIAVNGEQLVLDPGFIDDYKKTSLGGIIAYTLSSEIDPADNLAVGPFHYDIIVNADGTFAVPSALKAEMDNCGTAQIYIIRNDFITYTATLEHGHTWDDGVVTEAPTTSKTGVRTYTCTVCGKIYTESIPRLPITPVGPSISDVEEPGEKPAPAELPFTDVDDGWYRDDIVFVYENDLMDGVGGGLFAPDMTISRGMFVTVLWRMSGEPATLASSRFADVAPGSYYEQAVAWAAENNIVNGYTNGTFRPDSSITRQQMAAVLYRYTQYMGYDVSVGEDTNILSYGDVLEVSEYAYPALQWACGVGLVNGIDGNLVPAGNATRAEAAAILHRFCETVR